MFSIGGISASQCDQINMVMTTSGIVYWRVCSLTFPYLQDWKVRLKIGEIAPDARL